MRSRPEGARCPLCGCRVGMGNMRGHVASTRCLAVVARKGLVLDGARKDIALVVQALDASIARLMAPVTEVPRADS